jgi:predicted aldo/keto reductase-like oxidoreductase
MPILPTRVLGKTGIELPILGFGTAAAGSRLNAREAVRLFETALNNGVAYFDTAPEFAGYGKAQQYLGSLVRGRRREVFLVTKCFEPNGAKALRLLEQSLRELQTDYADLVFVHSLGDDKMDPKRVFSRQGVYEALCYAKAQGLTRWVGLSGHSRTARFAEAIERVEIDVLLNAVNFVDRHTYNFEDNVWMSAARRNIGLIAMKVFGGQGEEPSRTLSRCRMPQSALDAAFRYALSVPSVACAVIGMATGDELTQNLHRAMSFTPLSPGEQRSVLVAGHQLAGQWEAHLGPIA